jgi:hypothetical protein
MYYAWAEHPLHTTLWMKHIMETDNVRDKVHAGGKYSDT